MSPETKLLLVIEEFRKIDPVLPIQTAAAFLHIASATEDGTPIPMSKLRDALGISSSSVTRNVQVLSFRTDERRGGHDLVVTVPDEEDSRARGALLTPKGRRVWKTIKAIMEQP